MSKKKSKKKTSLQSKIRANAKLIVVVAVLMGVSFYMGIATPQSFSIPVNLATAMSISIEDSYTVSFGPFHSGARITFDVTSASHSWSVNILDGVGTPLTALSSSDTGTFSTAWLFSPSGCIIQIRSDTAFPTSMNLDGTLTITSSRFPFI